MQLLQVLLTQDLFVHLTNSWNYLDPSVVLRMDCSRNCTFTHQFVRGSLTVTGLCGAGHPSSHTETVTREDRTNRAGRRIFRDNFEIASSLVVSGNY